MLKAAVKVAYHTQLASSLAVKACHEILPDPKIGIVLNLTPATHCSQHPRMSRLLALRISSEHNLS